MASHQIKIRLLNSILRQSFSIHYRCSSAATTGRSSSSTSTSQSKDVEINIPYRIERGPTDILKALSATVKKDTYGPHYTFMDDPWMTPKSTIDKRAFALSKESGKKAAKYFLDNYPEWFSADPSEPKVERLSPPEKFDENTSVDEEDVIRCIATHDVTNAKVAFDIMVKNGQELSEKAKIDLLEFLCFYNGKDPLDDDYVEERWFKYEDQMSRNTWADDMHVNAVFKSLKSPDGRAYCALLLGHARHHSAKAAFKIYEEMKEKGIPINLQAYNALLELVPLIKESGETMWWLIEDLCKEMREANLKPNLDTYNAILNTLARCGTWRESNKKAMRVLSEMNRIGISPSLGTYAYLLEIFYPKKSSATPSAILYEIMRHIEGQEFRIAHPKDVDFFVTAMDIANGALTDVELAHKILHLYNTGLNYKLMGNAHNESLFYRYYMRLVCVAEPIERIMEIYSSLSPHIYIPEHSVLKLILQAIELYEAYEEIPRMWKDIQEYRMANREELLTEILRIGAKCSDPTLYPQLVDVAWGVLKNVKNFEDHAMKNYTRIPIIWSGGILSDALTIFIKGKDMVKSEAVLTKLEVDKDKIMGVPDAQVLKDFCKFMLECGQPQIVLRCVKYDSESVGGQVAPYVNSICMNYDVPENFKTILESFLGGDDTEATPTSKDENEKKPEEEPNQQQS